ncbi:50S ribosomal protein L37ae [Candidatus Woesearchaeota archaeon]|nr:50S ribosomal protein L37ae [Candidatus Woesearchaeota archaeon]
MATKKGLGSVKRFETRYGATTKQRMFNVESQYRGKRLECPFCGKKNVKRVFSGVWNCSKCETKFTGRAYNPSISSKRTEVEL